MVYKNSKGITYYLHKRDTIIGRNKIKTVTYFFRKEMKEDYFKELPLHLTVVETHSGLPVVKKF